MNINLDLSKIRMFILDNKQKVRMAALILIVGLSILFFWIHGDSGTIEMEEQGGDTDEYSLEEEDPEDEEKVISRVCYVDISGEVEDPGVYKVDSETRLFQVIEMAGGLTKDADLNSLNRAERVTDGQKIIVRALGEEGEESKDTTYSTDDDHEGIAVDGKINLNYADSDTLQIIPGIGPTKAQNIIDYREKTGKFKKIEEIMNVSGIGEKTFDSIKDYITV